MYIILILLIYTLLIEQESLLTHPLPRNVGVIVLLYPYLSLLPHNCCPIKSYLLEYIMDLIFWRFLIFFVKFSMVYFVLCSHFPNHSYWSFFSLFHLIFISFFHLLAWIIENFLIVSLLIPVISSIFLRIFIS